MLSRSYLIDRVDAGWTVQLSLVLDSGVAKGDGTGEGEVTMGTELLHLLVISSQTCDANWFELDFSIICRIVITGTI